MAQATDIWTVRRLIEWTTAFFKRKEVDPARLSAELLLSHVLKVSRIKLYTDYERILDDAHLHRYRELVKRAAEQEPIAYLTGTAHFFNLEFDVTRDVLIPRPDTETIVEHVMQLVRATPGMEAPRVLDLCTGSGCIAAAIAHHIKTSTVLATDISEAAVAVARKNIERLGLAGRVVVEQGDLFEPLARLADAPQFDLIVSNPPYIPTANIDGLDRSVRDYEPKLALDGGLDGMAIHRGILAGAPERLVAGGSLYMEIQFDQAEAALALFAAAATLENARVLKDHAGHDRVVTARKPADNSPGKPA